MNVFKEAVEKAKAKDKDLYSIERIAEAAGVSESAMYNYMSVNCGRIAPPEVIVGVSSYIHDLGLRNRYCSSECPIGRCNNPKGFKEYDLQTLGFMCKDRANYFIETFNKIYEMYADGQRTREEELIFKQMLLSKFYEIIEVTYNLINISEEF